MIAGDIIDIRQGVIPQDADGNPQWLRLAEDLYTFSYHGKAVLRVSKANAVRMLDDAGGASKRPAMVHPAIADEMEEAARRVRGLSAWECDNHRAFTFYAEFTVVVDKDVYADQYICELMTEEAFSRIPILANVKVVERGNGLRVASDDDEEGSSS